MRFIVILVAAVLAWPVQAVNRNYFSPLTVEGATTIDLQQAKALFDAGAVFVDVRPPRLFKRKHIPASYHLDLKNGFEKAALERIAKNDQPVVIYSSSVHCPRGYRAVALAVSWGYTNVKYFRGGIVEWRDARYPFEYDGPRQRATW
jgi:rhodanese-related sulfurtransferase